MKQITAPLCFLALPCLLCNTAYAQEPVWLKYYGNSQANRGFQLAYDGEGAVYGLGTVAGPLLVMSDTTVTVLGLQDILLAKWDTSGAVIWTRTAGGYCPPASDLDFAGVVVHDSLSDRIVISGSFECSQTFFGDHVLNGTQNNGKDLFIAAYDDSGECLWARSATGFDISFRKLLVDQASRVFVLGSARTAGITFNDTPSITLPTGGYIAKYGTDGSIQSAQRVLTNGEILNGAWTAADGWVLTGAARPNASLYGALIPVTSAQYDGFVAKVDTTGTLDWIKTFPSNGFSRILHVAALTNDKTLISGYFREDLILPSDTLEGPVDQHTFFLSILDASGVPEWTIPIRGTGSVFVNDVKVDPNGEILLYGRYNGDLILGPDTLPPFASTNGFVARFSQTGECKAAWGFGRTYYASGSILPTDHGLYLASEFDSTLVMGSYTVQGTHPGPDQGYHDLFIARFDSLSGFTTSVPAFKQATNDQLLIYANPNQGLCTVELPTGVLPGRDLLLIIRDTQGRLVQQENLRWHSGNLQLDIRAQARGIYHAELWDGDRRYTGKIIFQ